jgi:hypothetical protein
VVEKALHPAPQDYKRLREQLLSAHRGRHKISKGIGGKNKGAAQRWGNISDLRGMRKQGMDMDMESQAGEISSDDIRNGFQ